MLRHHNMSRGEGYEALIEEIYEDIYKVVYLEGRRDEELLRRTQVPALSTGKLISRKLIVNIYTICRECCGDDGGYLGDD